MSRLRQSIAGLSPLPQTAVPETWLLISSQLADLAFQIDPRGAITNFQPGTLLQTNALSLRGQNLANLVSTALGEDNEAAEYMAREEFRHVIKHVCHDKTPWSGQVWLRLGLSEPRKYRISLTPYSLEGHVLGAYGLLLDIAALSLTPADMLPAATISPDNQVIDFETHLWAKPVFAEQLSRRLDRLDVESLPGTLFYIDFSRSPQSLYSAISVRLTEELRDIVRPTDLLGRIDKTTIGLWCDGMDNLTAGERAARLCTTLPALLPTQQTPLTIAAATRWPDSGEDASAVLGHANTTLTLAKENCELNVHTRTMSLWRILQR